MGRRVESSTASDLTPEQAAILENNRLIHVLTAKVTALEEALDAQTSRLMVPSQFAAPRRLHLQALSRDAHTTASR